MPKQTATKEQLADWVEHVFLLPNLAPDREHAELLAERLSEFYEVTPKDAPGDATVPTDQIVKEAKAREILRRKEAREREEAEAKRIDDERNKREGKK